MVRKRGVARKSFSHRRVRRVKKYDYHVIPRRFKIYLPRMSDLLEEELPPCVLCEEPTMALLQSLGVPTDEWQYYLGFMKRMVELYLTFTSETLQKEKDSLIAEYVLRGKDKDVLEQVQAVSEVCAGIVVSCTEVKACLEGNYSSYSYQWKHSYLAEVFLGIPRLLTLDKTNNFIEVITHEDYRSQKVDLTTGAIISETSTLEFFPEGVTNRSLLSKYVGYVVNEGGVPKLKIFKNGTLLQTIDLSQAPISWTNLSKFYTTLFTPDGEYIIVDSNFDGEYALFKGS